MNWRASLFGALVVALAGLAVGVVVGGKKTVKTVTVTVAHASKPATTTTVYVPTTDTATDTSTTTADGPTTRGDSGTQQYLADYLTTQGFDELNNEASSVTLVYDPSSLQLKGQQFQHAVAFDLFNGSSGSTETFQMPIAGFSRLKSSSIGLETLTSASARYRLTIYKDHGDTPTATVLFRAAFHGPSDIRKLDFDTQGATVLVLVWTKTTTSEPDSDDNFILADPVLTR